MSEDPRLSGGPVEEEMATIARDFERREFSPKELATIKATRRRSPRLHEAETETQTFHASASLMDRIRERASSEGTTESQVIRDAVNAYLSQP